MTELDFTKLRAERDEAIQRIAREVHIKLGGDPGAPVTFHSCDLGGCYCACAEGGPCEHQFSGWREFDDGCGGEQVCSKCGAGGYKNGVRPARGGHAHKNAVLALVDRDSGTSRWFHVDGTTADQIHPIVLSNIAREARLMTDEATMYRKIGKHFAEHGHTLHGAGSYVDLTDRTIHTNTVEGAFSIFKRGMRGVYQHCAEHHLHRYLAEFEFRYNNRIANGVDDRSRAVEAVKGIAGKRLTYARPDEVA